MDPCSDKKANVSFKNSTDTPATLNDPTQAATSPSRETREEAGFFYLEDTLIGLFLPPSGKKPCIGKWMDVVSSLEEGKFCDKDDDSISRKRRKVAKDGIDHQDEFAKEDEAKLEGKKDKLVGDIVGES